MSKTSKLVVTLRKWDVREEPVYIDDELVDSALTDERLTEYTFARRDYPRGPEGKREFTADLVAAFRSEYVSFAETGNDWAMGEPSENYRDGSWNRISMHFADSTPAWVVRAVMSEVG